MRPSRGHKGGVWIHRIGGVPKDIAVTVRPAVMRYVTLPPMCSEEEAERIRAECAERRDDGEFDTDAMTVGARLQRIAESASGAPVQTVDAKGVPMLPEAPGVYFVRLDTPEDAGPIKIGVSASNMRRRVDDFNGGYPWRVVPLGWAHGSANEERMIHSVLASYRMNGEWFRPSEQVRSFVAKCMAVGILEAISPRKAKPVRFDAEAYKSWLSGDGPPQWETSLAA